MLHNSKKNFSKEFLEFVTKDALFLSGFKAVSKLKIGSFAAQLILQVSPSRMLPPWQHHTTGLLQYQLKDKVRKPITSHFTDWWWIISNQTCEPLLIFSGLVGHVSLRNKQCSSPTPSSTRLAHRTSRLNFVWRFLEINGH
jgi:hypothetical protein